MPQEPWVVQRERERVEDSPRMGSLEVHEMTLGLFVEQREQDSDKQRLDF